MRRFGKITEDYPTKHGHHFRIHLEKPVNFWDSIYLRKFLQDDIKRMFYDIMRYKHGLKIQDVLWQKKTYLRDAVLLKGEK